MLDAPIEDLNQAIEPRRIVTIWARVILIVILVGIGLTGSRIIWLRLKNIEKENIQELKTAEIQSFKRDWFVSKAQEIDGLKHQLKIAQNALTSIDEQRKKAWISHQSDRDIYNLAVAKVFVTEETLLGAIKEYNAAASIANPVEIAGLNSSISVN